MTVRVKPELPAVALFGESELTVGAGALMVKLTALEVIPPEACTLIEADPVLAIKLAGTVAVS